MGVVERLTPRNHTCHYCRDPIKWTDDFVERGVWTYHEKCWHRKQGADMVNEIMDEVLADHPAPDEGESDE